MIVLRSTAYLPPMSYISGCLRAEAIMIERFETFPEAFSSIDRERSKGQPVKGMVKVDNTRSFGGVASELDGGVHCVSTRAGEENGNSLRREICDV